MLVCRSEFLVCVDNGLMGDSGIAEWLLEWFFGALWLAECANQVFFVDSGWMVWLHLITTSHSIYD